MLGYLLCAGVFAALLIIGLTRWRRRLAGSGLIAVFSAQFAWSIVLAASAGGVAVPFGLAVESEFLRLLGWGWVLARSLRGRGDERLSRALQRTIAFFVAVTILWVVAGALPGAAGGRLAAALTVYWPWAGLGLAILGLVLVEQAARNTRSAHRWALKHVWLAIGGLFTWDLCLYSIVMLHGPAAVSFWLVRGYVNALLGVLLAVGLGRISGWESASFLSPRVVLFNATILAAALYVFVMAVGSYLLRQFGGTWGDAAQLLFLAAGALVLAVAVLSGQFRAWLRVMLAKHLFPYRYDYRNVWQALTRALAQTDETPVHDRIPKVLAGFVHGASGGLWLRDAEGAYVPAGGDLAPPTSPSQIGNAEFFDFLREQEWVFDLDEARSAPGSGSRPTPPGWLLEHPRMWLVVPLICEDALIGFIGIGRPLVAVEVGWEEIDLLRAAGRQVASFLAFEQAAKRLAEAHQFEAMNRLSAVLMHDLRHLIAQQALVVENASRHRGNPEFFDDAILTIENSVKRMTRVMEELRSGVLAGQSQRIDLAEIGAEVARRCADRSPVPALEARDRMVEVVVNRDRLLQVLEHVVRNAQEATPVDGSVILRVRRADSFAQVEVVDTGCGMDAQFIRDRLFKPFDTTKGERGFGIGAYEAREFVRKCGGKVEVDSTPGRGTRFLIALPLAPTLLLPTTNSG